MRIFSIFDIFVKNSRFRGSTTGISCSPHSLQSSTSPIYFGSFSSAGECGYGLRGRIFHENVEDAEDACRVYVSIFVCNAHLRSAGHLPCGWATTCWQLPDPGATIREASVAHPNAQPLAGTS